MDPGVGTRGRPEGCDDRRPKKSYLDHQPRQAERFAVIEQARGAASVTDLCEALEVSESGYYAWRETKANRHDQRDAYLTTCIQTVFDDSRHTYGSNRVEAALRGEGICTSRKR